MHPWIEQSESWINRQYKTTLGIEPTNGRVRLRWLGTKSLTEEVSREEAQAVVIEDSDIGWLLFLLPYEPDRLEMQIHESLGVRSRLLDESNYTGNEKPSEQEDADSSWRLGLLWLVKDSEWLHWQRQILELRRESGAAEEISFDALSIKPGKIDEALDSHGFPRLLLHTRALLSRSPDEAELWLSADNQVSSQFRDFSKSFSTPRARHIARELEKLASQFIPPHRSEVSTKPRQLRQFRIKHFRNLETLEIAIDPDETSMAQAVVLFGPNGTGKSSLAEALCLAAFGTSPRLEQFLDDKDIRGRAVEAYLEQYMVQLRTKHQPSFVWDNRKESPFTLKNDVEARGRYEGVILNQEDSLKFTALSSQALAALVLKGYSALADQLSSWLLHEEARTKDIKNAFAHKHKLAASIRLSETAYDRLAQGLLGTQLNRPSPEFLNWLDFLGRRSDQAGVRASQLASAWRTYQENIVSDLASVLARLQSKSDAGNISVDMISEGLEVFDKLAEQSNEFSAFIEKDSTSLRNSLDESLAKIDLWSSWLAARTTLLGLEKDEVLEPHTRDLKAELLNLEKRGKTLRARLDLLGQAQEFLTSHWSSEHPNICPVCDSDVETRNGIESVVSSLRNEVSKTVVSLRSDYADVQKRQKELAGKPKTNRRTKRPLSQKEQTHLMDLLSPFLPEGAVLEDWLTDRFKLQQLIDDLSRMKLLPDSPKPYSDIALEAKRLADEFAALAREADEALEGPQAIHEVKVALELKMETVLMNHLPSTLGKVWREIALTLTPAAWLLPELPKLQLQQRGKALSIQLERDNLLIRYIYNAAERHVLGLAWFFTYYLARRRFEEAWMLLDDAAQEMDEPSFRELIRFIETLLRIHQRKADPFTLVVTLHQEDRAVDAARATNGKLYLLGWQRTQDDSGEQSSVKQVVLLAPGFHPLKPEMMFG